MGRVAGRRPVGWGGQRSGALANSSHSTSSPPPVTSFAALARCHPPHKWGRDKEERPFARRPHWPSLHPSPFMGETSEARSWGGWLKASRVGLAANWRAREDIPAAGSPPPVTSFAALTMCHPPHKWGRDKKESFARELRCLFIPPLSGARRAKLALGVARSAGWGWQRIGALAKTPPLPDPPPVTSFAALTMCPPSPQVGEG